MNNNATQKARLLKITALAVLLLIGVAVLMPLIGSTRIDYGRAFAGESPDAEILFYARLPRVLLSLLVGGALAVTGVLFQALVRDALADPYVLGYRAGPRSAPCWQYSSAGVKSWASRAYRWRLR